MGKTIQYTVKQACEIIGVPLPAKYEYLANEVLANITHHSNSLVEGGGFIMFGDTEEVRQKKLHDAIAKKQKVIFHSKACNKMLKDCDIPHIALDNWRDTIVRLSSAMRNELGIKVVGVTGSIGKTSTKEMIHAVLRQCHTTTKTQGNLNTLPGIFSAIYHITDDVEYHVQEYSMSYTDTSMARKVAACTPDAAVITNISDCHIESVGSRENIFKLKQMLITEAPEGTPAFLNYDDEILKNAEFEGHPIVSFAVKNKWADYRAENIQVYEGYMEFDIVHTWHRTHVRLNAVGVHNVSNALVAMAVGEWAGIPTEKIVQGIAEFKTEGIRQTLSDIGGYKLYIDCYNAAPMSMMGAVHTLEQLPLEKGGRRIAVVGQMRELGPDSENMHRQVGQEIGSTNVDLVLCFGGEDTRVLADTVRNAGKEVYYTDDRLVFNELLKKHITRKDIALFKASHGTALHKSIDCVYGTNFYLYDDFARGTCDKYNIIATLEPDKSERAVGISRYRGTEQEPTIPRKYQGAFITCVGTGCFEGNGNITKVIIPESVNNIGANAFANCSSLVEVVLPKGLKMISKDAFKNCTSLESITIPEGVIEIAEGAFENCSKLKELSIPASVGRIGENAFKNCAAVISASK